MLLFRLWLPLWHRRNVSTCILCRRRAKSGFSSVSAPLSLPVPAPLARPSLSLAP